MLLDKFFYEHIIEIFNKNVNIIFGSDMKNTSEVKCFAHMGNFNIEYKYIPYNYTILISNELRSFDIRIVDSEGAFNELHRIKEYNNELCEQNIKEALYMLKNVLLANDFNRFLYIEGKLYKKNKKGIIRVKDIKELLKG